MKVKFLFGGSGKYFAKLPDEKIVSGQSPIIKRYARRGDNKAEVISFLQDVIRHPVDNGIRLGGGYIFEIDEGKED